MKKISFFILLFLFSSVHAEINKEKSKVDEVCNTEETKGSSTRASNACSQALYDDSHKKLAIAIAEVKSVVKELDGPINIRGGGDKKEWMRLFDESQMLWEKYVKVRCDFSVYAYGEIAQESSKKSCIAMETYFRAENLGLNVL